MGSGAAEQTRALLEAVFPGAPGTSPEYLRWLYEQAPQGRVIEANRDDDQGRVGHYAIVPVSLVRDGESEAAALSLNTAVHERARGQGLFTELALSAYERAAAAGIRSVVGVANQNSTHGFIERLGFSLLGPLPVRVMVPCPGRSVQIADGLSTAGETDALLAHAQSHVGACFAWTDADLRWRLARPGTDYLVHRGQEWIAVSTRSKVRGVPVAVLLGVFAARSLSRSEMAALVRRACRLHAAPLLVHAGVNVNLPVAGLPVPVRMRPSPLNLIYRELSPSDRPVPAFSRFEFIDFDAY